jgi:hypothetical protein
MDHRRRSIERLGWINPVPERLALRVGRLGTPGDTFSERSPASSCCQAVRELPIQHVPDVSGVDPIASLDTQIDLLESGRWSSASRLGRQSTVVSIQMVRLRKFVLDRGA